MINSQLKTRAIQLYDDFAHRHHDRRAFMRDLTALTGSAITAQALLSAISPDAAKAAISASDDKRLSMTNSILSGAEGRKVDGYLARPLSCKAKCGAVLVVHENRGLNDHIRDVARRIALEGFVAFAPDFLSEDGGTPVDQDAARALIGKLDLARSVADGVALIAALKTLPKVNGKVGITGFCWGGGMVNRLAVASGAALSAAVPYYGPAPAPEEARKVKARMLMNYAALDDRVNATAKPWLDALKAAGVPVEAYFYEGANHAFNNDTSAERYNKAVADIAWQRMINLFKVTLS
jgi:carboxymethylenebutenolidase